ncbi:MAG: beta-phosphoglucomutase family hydrolase [Candidatus Omnitrophota bacterium]
MADIRDEETSILFKAVVFDLDGVITQTALVHAASWKEMFDEYLKKRQDRDGEPFKEFTHASDYLPYVDGKPRYKGVESFLKSRHISLPFGDPSDSDDKETICGLGNRKNKKFKEILARDGVQTYKSTVQLIQELKARRIHTGVASSSKNCLPVLKKAGLDALFETCVDGIVSEKLGLKGKPDADIFVAAAKNMGVLPGESIVVEDAVSGVQAGRRGGFGLVIGIARENNESSLTENGADVVITDFEGVDVTRLEEWFLKKNSQRIKDYGSKG